MREGRNFFGIPTSVEGANLYVMGIPWYESASFRKCSKDGVRVLREATSSELYNPFNEDLVKLTEKYRILDLGDIEVDGISFKQLMDVVESEVRVHNTGDAIFMFLGGDHSITIATTRAIKQVTDNEFGLVYFDAHPDLYEIYDGDPYSHACVLKRLIDDGVVAPENVVLVGIRAPTADHVRDIRENKINMITASELYHRGIDGVREFINELRRRLKSLYISFDLDVLDPAFAPGVGNPEAGGISTRELIEAIKLLKGFRVIGFDIVEYCLEHDVSQITAFASAKIIRETLGVAKAK